MVAGLIVGAAIYPAGLALGWSDEVLLVASALGQYAGHILGLVALARAGAVAPHWVSRSHLRTSGTWVSG